MRLTINVAEQKAAFFLELLLSLDKYVTTEAAEASSKEELSVEHKRILDARLASYQEEGGYWLDGTPINDKTINLRLEKADEDRKNGKLMTRSELEKEAVNC